MNNMNKGKNILDNQFEDISFILTFRRRVGGKAEEEINSLKDVW